MLELFHEEMRTLESRRREVEARLTRRESQVLGCLLRGASEKEVASDLAISQHTVHSHVKSIYKAHRVSSRAALLVRCLSAFGA
jgi:DNA-binding NarL/FixJ family response regulator